jgi:hypothetical protein
MKGDDHEHYIDLAAAVEPVANASPPENQWHSAPTDTLGH